MSRAFNPLLGQQPPPTLDPLAESDAEQKASRILAEHKQEPPPFGPNACGCGWRDIKRSWESHVAKELKNADVLVSDRIA